MSSVELVSPLALPMNSVGLASFLSPFGAVPLGLRDELLYRDAHFPYEALWIRTRASHLLDL